MNNTFTMDQAIQEANRCLLCHDAPCSKGCPAQTDPAKFIRKLRLKNITGAIRTIKENNILGGACGALCPTAELCEKECSSKELDRPIQIGKIQKCLTDYAKKIEFNVFDEPNPSREKIAIVGSGPAGLSCAAELAKNGYKTTIFEEKPEPGGVLRYGVPSERFPEECLRKELDDIDFLGVEIKCSSPIKDSSSAENLLKEGFSAVFLAPGLWQSIKLAEKENDTKGLFTSVDFLKGLRAEQSKEIKKDLNGKKVAVIGGGSVAMDCAESAINFGATDVYVIYRRSYTQMPAEEDEKLAALRMGAHFLSLNQPIDYISDNNKLTGIKLVRTELGETDSSRRRSPINIEDSEWVLNVDIAIEAIGTKPEEDSTNWYPSVKTTEKKLVIADDETCKTSVDGIFAGGDIVRGPSLIVNAVLDGKTAAKNIMAYLNKE